MNNPNHSVLDDERIGRLLLKQSIPAFMGIFVTATYGIVNTIFVGHFVGSLGIAGIAMVLPVQMLSMGVGQMFGVGGASLISRSIGVGNRDRAERALGNAITAVVVMSVIIMIVGLLNTDFWLRIMGTTADILPYARDYFTVILFGLFFQTFAMSLSSLIRSEGSARVSMVGMVIGAISNIIFDSIFIIALRMGVKGAAIGTVIAQFLSVAYYMYFYFRGESYLKIRVRNLAFKWDVVRGMLAIGVSTFIMSFTSSTSSIF